VTFLEFSTNKNFWVPLAYPGPRLLHHWTRQYRSYVT